MRDWLKNLTFGYMYIENPSFSWQGSSFIILRYEHSQRQDRPYQRGSYRCIRSVPARPTANLIQLSRLL